MFTVWQKFCGQHFSYFTTILKFDFLTCAGEHKLTLLQKENFDDMQHGRILSMLKHVSPLFTHKRNQHANAKTKEALSKVLSVQQRTTGDAQLTIVRPMSTTEKTDKIGVFQRLKSKINIFDISKYVLMTKGAALYENTVDNLDYNIFYTDFNMADTLFSWFLVTELHIWMLLTRCMAEGEKGKIIRNTIVELMWVDVENRIDKLGQFPGKSKHILQLSNQFNAAVIGYDEGIMSEDKVLAGALWRRFFKLECNNPEHLERLVIYVRKQMHLLDKLPAKDMIYNKRVDWIDLKSIR